MPIRGAATTAGAESAGSSSERLLVERQTVVVARDAERLAEPSRAGAEQPRIDETASLLHQLDPVRRLEPSDQHRRCTPLVLADEVQAPVDAVRAVDVCAAGRAEHRRVPRRPPAEPVRRRVHRRLVCLCLDDRPADAVHEQRDADQRRRDLVDAPGEELAREHLEEL